MSNSNNSLSKDITPIDDKKTKNIKYPFSGIATNLIDKFLVLGYDQKIIDYTCINNEVEPFGSKMITRFKYFEFEEMPNIVNELCNDYTKDLLENDLILELIFPNKPQMYFLKKQYVNQKLYDEELLITNYSIIFSINPQDNSGSKRSYNGLGYVFYVNKEYKIDDCDGVLYIPTTYVILSEFPYFYHFNEICRNIYSQIRKENDEIPIDILIYNIIKFLQSPIKKGISLTFGALLNIQKKENDFEKVMKPFVTPNPKNPNEIPSIYFNQLSGYPFLDLNLSFIFNLIPPDIIIEVFIFSFLEHDIIFYSSRPEILNMVMYIFSNLNFPFNDSIYYWHILSVSKESFMTGSSTFVGKTSSTLTGILSIYDPEVLTTKKISEHFVLDIDNKTFFFLYQEETEEVKNTMILYNYIKNCTNELDDTNKDKPKKDKEEKSDNCFDDGIQLYEAIKILMEELQRRAKKVTSIDYNNKIIKPSFLILYEEESEFECNKSNLRLQKAFFTFITQILQNFLSILSIEEDNPKIDSEKRLPSIVVNIKQEELNEEEKNKRKLASKAGRIFKLKFKDSSKYSSFVINFCKFHDSIDLYKIPYTFINEFVYYSHIAVQNNLSEVDVFKLIDQFYGKNKCDSLEAIIQKSDKIDKKDKKKKIHSSNIEENNNPNDVFDELEFDNVYVFNFNNFIEYYKKHLRNIINREQEDDKEIFIKVKNTQKAFKKYKRNGYYLSNKLLNIYSLYCNNNFDKMIKLFKLIKCQKIEKSDNNLELDYEDGELFLKKISSSAPPSDLKKKNIRNNYCIDENNNNNNIIIYEEDNENILYNRKMDKVERDLKIFGSYEFNDITDVIQRHFILERCFTSYGLIKFSLLNVLGITRGIEGLKIKNPKVIQTVCKFCEITKSLVRKYMNIYLSIFQALKTKDIIQDKKQCDICLGIIASHFRKTNMIPTEETTNTMKEIRESLAPKENVSDETEDKNYIELVNNFIKKNGTFFAIQKDGILSLKENTEKKFTEVMTTIETIFLGNFTSNSISKNIISFDYKELEQLYKDAGLKSKKDKKIFYPKTPLVLYASTNKLLNNYLNNNFTNNDNIYDELLLDILTLLYYFKIPLIKEKWIDQYKSSKTDINMEKAPLKEKLHKKTTKKSEKDKIGISELKETIQEIIAILIDLFSVIKNIRKK